MAPAPDWIAIDRGATSLRAWAMGAEGVLDRAEAPAPADGGSDLAALLSLLADWLPADGTVPAVACGMAAPAALRPVPCVPLPPGGPTRAAPVDPRLTLHLIPGLIQATPRDMTQGDETRIAGFLALSPDFDGVVCLTGPQTRWARISAGEVVSFQTFVTGELCALLADRLPPVQTNGAGADQSAFAAALDDALSRPDRLAARLFTPRTEALVDSLPPQTALARLQGALIGAELAAAKPWWLGQSVVVIGAPPLADLYATALSAQGLQARVEPEEQTTLAGLGLAHLRTAAP